MALVARSRPASPATPPAALGPPTSRSGSSRLKKWEADRLRSIEDPEVARQKRELHEERRRLLAGVDSKEKKDLADENDRLRKRLREIDTDVDGGAGSSTLTPGAAPVAAGGGSPTTGRAADRLRSDALGRAPAGAVSDAMRTMMEKGWSREQAAGIVANLHAESGMHPGAVGDGGLAYGAAQWHPDRQANFERWSGRSMRGSSLEDQLAFVHHELTDGAEQRAGRLLRGTNSASDAAAIVSWHYERPLDADGAALHRAQIARQLMTRSEGTPMPPQVADAGAGAGRGSINPGFNVTASPMDLRISFDRQGNPVTPDGQSVPLRVGAARPFGLSGPTGIPMQKVLMDGRSW